MSQWTSAFTELYQCQTEAHGVAIVATVGAVAAAKPALLTVMTEDQILVAGGNAEIAGYTLEMLISDFSGEPPKGAAVSCNGDATGHALEVLKFSRINSATFLIECGDFAAEG